MRVRHVVALAVALAAGVSACPEDAAGQSAPDRREPYVGFLHPAGGRRGTVVRVTAGGQNLAGVTGVHVTGGGVRASVVRFEGTVPRLNGDQRRELWRRLEAARAKLRPPTEPARDSATGPPISEMDAAEMDRHPLLRVLGTLDLAELDRVETRFLRQDDRRQPNAQIAESVVVEVTLDPDAAPGDREVRLVTRTGLTNPLRFQVGTLPEVAEDEPVPPKPPSPPVVTPPALLNGRVMPGEVDRFRIRARKGQRLVIEARARRLIPYLADAVPGWFQATLSLRDGNGREVAFADDWRFDPDPVLLCEIPRDGEYRLEITDALYRGREDFVYRISVGEEPFVTTIYPLGGRAGAAATTAVFGWNLPVAALRLDTRADGDGIRWTEIPGASPSNRFPYVVDDLPEADEPEPDDAARDAPRIDLPRVVNGRIARPGDVDTWRFAARRGDEIVAEVLARRLHSPLDSVLRILGPDGTVFAWNDDHEDRAAGLLTHHADSYVRFRVPADGTWGVQVADVQGHGGEDHAYRLRIGPPRPDFAAVVTPSSVNVPPGRAVPVTVHVLRKDGFDGDVDLALVDAPPGFVLSGGRVPGGRDRVRATLTAPRERTTEPVTLRLEASARIGTAPVTHRVVPSQDLMQAFAYRHLAASQELVVAVVGAPGRAPEVDLPAGGRVRIPAGGAARVRVRMQRAVRPGEIRLELNAPPAGVTLAQVDEDSGGWLLTLRADARAARPGDADNLIVEGFAETGGKPGKDGTPTARRTVQAGWLPAIPVEIVR